ncbi:GNAT family N-acetyltransferase [soil metagenome]
MTEVTIREFRDDDIAALDRVYSQPSVILNTLSVPYTTGEERSRRFTVSGHGRIVVAEINEEPAGFGDLRIFVRRRAHAAHIGLAVDSAHADRGVGSALLQALIDLGERWYGIKRFELKVFTANSRATDLYRRFGFTIEATHRQFALRDGEYADAYTMARLRD